MSLLSVSLLFSMLPVFYTSDRDFSDKLSYRAAKNVVIYLDQQ